MFELILVFLVTHSNCVEGSSSLKSGTVTGNNKTTSSDDYSQCYDIKHAPRSFHDALEDCTADGHVLAYVNNETNLQNDPIVWLLDEQSKQTNIKRLSKMWLGVVNADGRWLYTVVEWVGSSKIAQKVVLQRANKTYGASTFQSLAYVMHTTASYACYTCGNQSPKCQKNAVYHEGHCYWLGSPEPVPYIESVAHCQSQGGIPVLAKDMYVNGFLVALQSSYGIKDMWLGLHKMEPGPNWYYSDDELFVVKKDLYDQLDFFCVTVSFKESNQHHATCTYIDSAASYRWKCSRCEKKQLRALCTDFENPCEGENSYFHMGNCYYKVQHGNKCEKKNVEKSCPVGSTYFEENQKKSYRFQYLKARDCSDKSISCLEITDDIDKMCGCVVEAIF